jgi:hypothetical protein
MLFLLACWQPASYTPPEPPEEAQIAASQRPDLPEGQQAEEDQNPADETPEIEAPPVEEPEAPPFTPYPARLSAAPAMLVDDLGQPVLAMDKAHLKLEVRADEGYRKRVLCLDCKPQAEGWLQDKLVEAIP